MKYLTERQRDVLAYIEQCCRERGVAPTLKEIAEEFSFSSTASAQKHIALMVKKGFLRREKHQKRGLVVVRREPTRQPGPAAIATTSVPMLGTIAAGYPIESIPDEEPVAVPPDLLRSGDHYVLKVTGDSMIDDGILDGDWVVVQRRSEAASGETVVALVAGEATLKRLYRHDEQRIRLQPANPTMPPLIVPAADVTIQGVVVGLLRRY
jgi:repressor LexA